MSHDKLRFDFHHDIAQMFVNEVYYRRSNNYYFLGKIIPWVEPESIEDYDPAPLDTQEENNKIRSNIVYAKKIMPAEISLACKNYTWTYETVFAKWDSTKEMENENFYCVTDEFRVYKCLDNCAGKPSLIKPQGTSVYPLRTDDGYLWKYMYTIPASKQQKFMSLDHIPVQRALSDSFYNRGSVDHVVITEPGSGYTDVQLTVITITESTIGSGATVSFDLDGIGKIIGITVVNQGSNYDKGGKVVITSSTGAGAVLTPVFLSGKLVNVVIEDGGTGYSISDSITIEVGGAVLVPSISRETGSLTGVTIIDPGAGYVTPPVLALVGVGGTGLYEGNSSAIITAVLDQGKIARVTISDPGQNYPVDTATTITVFGDGEGAQFSPVIYNGELVDVIIENAGIGYTFVNLNVVGGLDYFDPDEVTTAQITGVISQSDFQSDQSIIEQTAIAGAIHAIEVINPGSSYTNDVQVSVTGDGEGCTAVAHTSPNGTIEWIEVTNFGQGYTYATVTITDIIGTEATAYAIFPPEYGHGTNAPSELYGNWVVINTPLQQELILGDIDQEFRQFGILKNPKNTYTGRTYDNLSELLLYKVKFNTTDGLIEDEVLTIDGKYRFIVAGTEPDNIVLLQNESSKLISPTGIMIAESDPSRQYVSNELIYTPILNKYSGKLLYVSNEPWFTFSENQGITIRTFIKF